MISRANPVPGWNAAIIAAAALSPACRHCQYHDFVLRVRRWSSSRRPTPQVKRYELSASTTMRLSKQSNTKSAPPTHTYQTSSVSAVTNTGHVIVTDLPRTMGGLNQAPQPVELLLAALAGCTQATAVYVLRQLNHESSLEELGEDPDGSTETNGSRSHRRPRRGMEIEHMDIQLSAVRNEQEVPCNCPFIKIQVFRHSYKK
jgi:uncharacterized OsmC-like protein